MPFCGYDPLMGDAVRTLAEGLVRSMGSRATLDELSLPEQLAGEAVELEALRELMSTSAEHGGPQEDNPAAALLGIVLVIRYLMQPEFEKYHSREGFERAVLKRAEDLDRKMQVFEQTFYGGDREVGTLDERLAAALSNSVVA